MKRNLVAVLICLVVAAMGYGSGSQQTQTETQAGSGAPALGAGGSGRYHEAPGLAALVNAGQLPPVDQRLPAEPVVAEVADGIGTYGGTWTDVSGNININGNKLSLYDPPIGWTRELDGYRPNLFKNWEYSNEGRTVTFTLREGVKWSDGVEFTAADIEFWWSDLALNAAFRGSGANPLRPPYWGLNNDGTPARFEVLDAYRWRLTFNEPHVVAHTFMARGFEHLDDMLRPKHYLMQFHPDFTQGATYQELGEKVKWSQNPDHPTLSAWQLVQWTPTRVTFERNPYYWKVDPSGNQLPYLDRYVVEIVSDAEVQTLQISQGQYDMTFRNAVQFTQLPFMIEQGRRNGFRVLTELEMGTSGVSNWMINQTWHRMSPYNPDEETASDVAIRELLQDRNFRLGLAHSLDRATIADTAFLGMIEPKGYSPSPHVVQFADDRGQQMVREISAMYKTFDLERAARYFDEAGFVDRNRDGWRDLPGTSERFELVIEVTGWGEQATNMAVAQIWQQDLERLGVRVILDNLINAGTSNHNAGTYMITDVGAADVDYLMSPPNMFPVDSNNGRAWPEYSRYFGTGGEQGWRPPDGHYVWEMVNLYRSAMQNPDPAAQRQLVQRAAEIRFIENGPFRLSVGDDKPYMGFAMNYVKNIQSEGRMASWWFGAPGAFEPATFYYDRTLYREIRGRDVD